MTVPDPQDLLDDLQPTAAPIASPPVQAWALVALLSVVLSVGATLGAGAVLDARGLGRAAVHRGCEGGLAAGLALLVLGGVFAGVARVTADRRHAHEIFLDGTRMLVATLPPLLLLVAAAPGFAGCAAAVRLEQLGSVGDALLGAPGFAVAAAAAFGTGLALTMAVRVRVPAALIVAEYERLQAVGDDVDLVERALAAHDLTEEGAVFKDPLADSLDQDRGEGR